MVNPLILSNNLIKFFLPAVFLCNSGHVTAPCADEQLLNTGPEHSITKHALYRATANLFNDLPLPGISRPISTNITVGPENMFLLYYGNQTCTKTYIHAVDQILAGTEYLVAVTDTKFETNNCSISDYELFPKPNEQFRNQRLGIFQAAFNRNFTAARFLTGQFLSQLQKFYRQINSTENGISSEDLAEPMLPIPECNSQSHVKTTEEYYESTNRRSNGTNTDSIRSITSNVCNTIAAAAQIPALEASVHFLDSLRESLGNRRFSEFLSIRGGRTLAIALETTKSMGPYLNAVKRRVSELIDASIQDKRNAIADYVIVPFSDKIGPAFRTENPNDFVAHIDKLTVERSYSWTDVGLAAILTASRLSSEYSGIFVFSEDKLPNYILFDLTVSTLAQRKQTVYFIGNLAGSIPYNEMSEKSSGEILQTNGTEENIFKASGIMSHKKMGNCTILATFKSTRSPYNIEIDPFVEKFDFILTGPRSTAVLKVTQYGGSDVTQTSGYALVNETDSVKVFHFEKPTAGKYSFTVILKAFFNDKWSADVIADSYFDIVFSLIDDKNCRNTIHGYRLIRTNPTAGQNAILSARSTCCKCKLKTAFLVFSNGTIQGDGLRLTYVSESVGYLAPFIVPDYPFYFKVTGEDENSNKFQRLQANHFIPTSLRIACNLPAAIQMVPGERRNISWTLFNTKIALNKSDEASTNIQYKLNDDCRLAKLLFPPVMSYGWSNDIIIQVQQNVSGDIQVLVPQHIPPGTVCDVSVVMWPTFHPLGSLKASNSLVLQTQVAVVSNLSATNLKPPTCNVTASTLNSCCDAISTECNSSRWHGELEVFDIDSKIINVFTKVEGEGQVRINSSDQSNVFIAANTTAVLNVTGDCCITEVAFRVVDDTGLTGRCSVKRKETSAGLDPPRKPWYGTRLGTLIGVTTGVVLIVVVFVLVTLRLRGYLKSKHNTPWLTVMGSKPASLKRSSERERAQTKSLELGDQLGKSLVDRISSHLVIPKWRITVNRGSVLGAGYFGKVYMGELTVSTDRSRVLDPRSSLDHQLVAVKTWKNIQNDRLCRAFYLEANTMIKIGRHPNIVFLLGVCLEDEMSLILEHCSKGALDKFLRASRELLSKNVPTRKTDYYHNSDPSSGEIENQIVLKEDDLITLCSQICSGMSYISSLGIIHRDLAARNILVNYKMVAKIADFGMAREESEYILERTDVPLPVKWLAPESIQSRTFSSQSDVWSFGIVVWEIFTFAENPYADCCSPTAFEQFYNTLKNGYRLHRPPEMKDEMYKLMTRCWEWKNENRPTFVELLLELEKLLDPETHERYVTFDNVC